MLRKVSRRPDFPLQQIFMSPQASAPLRLFAGLLIGIVFGGSLARDGFAQGVPASPTEFLGYATGEAFTPHHRVVDYFEQLAETSPRVHLEPYGQSVEGRALFAAFISSPENIARLEAIRGDNLRRASIEPGAASAESPVLVWLSYNVHGNEASSTEAAMETAFRLATGNGGADLAWLDDVVVVIDPALNPDGRERYVRQFESLRGRWPDVHPEAREHRREWPGARTNHYLFDLNRDWAWQVQPESKRRVALYNRWLPQVHVDFHEQSIDDGYYFAPAAAPLHPAVTDWQQAFQERIGRSNARRFDAEGWLYFTGESFDLLYPSYGDSWPTFSGAVGMTYEQAGQEEAGLRGLMEEGDTLSLEQRIRHHVATGLSTVATAAASRAELLEAFARFYNPAERPTLPYRAFVVRADTAADRIGALARLLDRQDIRYGFLREAQTLRGRNYLTSNEARFTATEGDLVVSTDQPKGVLASVLFDPSPALSDSLTYDITSWALPHVFGLDAYAVLAPVEGRTEDEPLRPAQPPLPASAFAYIARWQSPEDAAFLASLLRAGVRVRMATEPFKLADDSFARGTLLIAKGANGALGTTFDSLVQDSARAHGRRIWAASTGLTPGGLDLGSATFRSIAPPRVAVLSGEPASPYSLGEIWYHFDYELGYPTTLIDSEDLTATTLADYTVLVLPEGSYDAYFKDGKWNELLTWVREGGRLVAVGKAAYALAGREGLSLQPKEKSGEDTTQVRRTPYAARRRDEVSDDVPGSLFRVAVDVTHPLAFGYGDTYVALRRGADAAALLKDGWNVGVLESGVPLSGFAGHGAQAKIEGTLAFGTEQVGEGVVVYLMDNPLFRGFWYNGEVLFDNAVLAPLR